MVTRDEILQLQERVKEIYVEGSLEEYIVQLVMATREPQRYNEELATWVQFGASPRATIALDRCAKAHAWLAQRDYVSPEDIQAIAHDVLRHRIILSFAAEAEGVTTDSVITQLLKRVAVP